MRTRAPQHALGREDEGEASGIETREGAKPREPEPRTRASSMVASGEVVDLDAREISLVATIERRKRREATSI